MRLLRLLVIILGPMLFVCAEPAFAQIKHAPKCTIAEGANQVKTEGGTCGWGTTPTDGDLVVLTDATSKSDCGQACGGSAGGGTVPNLCIYRESSACLESSGSGDMTRAVYDTDSDNVVDQAAALENDPATCTGDSYVKDMNAAGTLACSDPLTGRTLDELTGVTSVQGTDSYLRWHQQESVTSGDALCYDANGNVHSCGTAPGGATNVEDHASLCSSGQGYLSTGSAADCAEVATDAELAAASDLPESLAGELAVFSSITGSAGIDWTGYSYASAGNNWTEVTDVLGHWRFRSQGDSPGSVESSLTWMLNNLICFEPEHTFRLWLNPHCSDASNETSRREGWKCTDDASCSGPTSKCIHDGTTYPVMWDQSASPDTFNWITQSPWPYGGEPAAHDFGDAGTVFPLPMALERGHSSAPVHEGSSAAYPTCTGITMADASNYWVVVVDSDTIELAQDDGDLVAEPVDLCTASGVPYACCTGAGTGSGCDPAVDCTTRSDWQTLALRPRNPDGSDPVKSFYISMLQGIYFVDSDVSAGNGPWRCVMGTDAGSNCTDHWSYDGTQTAGCASGICLPVVDPITIGYGFAVDGYEGVESSDLDYSTMSYVTGRDHETNGSIYTAVAVDMIPGECLQAIGYAAGTVDGDLDTLGEYGSTITITEARRSGPQRVDCAYFASSGVGVGCMHYAHLTNRDAAGAIELELASFEAGMDFCAVNETGNTFAIDPNGTERLLSPATDADGDKLTSAVEGDVVCAHVFADGEARVTFNSGGWNDGGP